jgi:hypothetical protein
MLQTGRSSIIACCQNLFVFDEDGSHLPPETGGTLGHEMSDVHEILIPGRPTGMDLFFLFSFQGRTIERIFDS